MKNNEYDWADLYKRAGAYICSYVPEAVVHESIKKIHNGIPHVEVSFPQKNNKKVLELLKKDKRIIILRGLNIGGARVVRADIVFNKNGTLN